MTNPIDTTDMGTPDPDLSDPVPVDALPEAPVAGPAAAVEANPDPASATLENRVAPGSILERTHTGWKVRLAYGGQLRLHGEGDTLHNALKDAGY